METETKKCAGCKGILSLDKFKKSKGNLTKCCQRCLDRVKKNRPKSKENQCSRCLKIGEPEDFGIIEKTGKQHKVCKKCRKIDIPIPKMNKDERFCKTCEQICSLDQFRMVRGKLTLSCIACLDKDKKARDKSKENKCTNCLIIRKPEEFDINKKTGKRYHYCKFCREKTIPEINENEQCCSTCKKIVPLDQFKIFRGKITVCCENCLNRNKEFREKLDENHCSKCLQIRAPEEFGINEKTGDRYKRCKICRKVDEPIPKMNEDERYCKICETVQSLANFVSPKGGYTQRCRNCLDKSNINAKNNKCIHDKRRDCCRICGTGAAYCKHNLQKRLCTECNPIYEDDDTKECSYCRKILNKDNFIGDKGQNTVICITCRGKNGKKQKVKCCHGARKNLCAICEPQSHLMNCVRASISYALKKNKNNSSIEYLGCDIKTYKKYIEDLFEDDMSWENHGMYNKDKKMWQIDHIVPLKFKKDDKEPTIDDIIERLHYLNTKPKWAIDNIKKGNRHID